MKKHLYSRAGRIGCLILALVFAVSWPTAAAASGESTKKDETVYVSLNASGGVQNTTVSDWLHSEAKNVRVADRSNLKNIVNVKSSEQPAQTGDELTWVMNGSGDNGADIYYQGKTSAKTPLTVSVSYSLNGKAVTPAQIAGKSGKVQIQINLKNTDAHTVNVDGKSTVMYTPMTAVVAATLPSDTFRNVSVSKGKVVSDGNNQFVTFLAMPGLSESLNLKNCGVDEIESLDFPDSLTITADTTDFTLGPIAVAATPELPNEDDFKSSKDIDDMKTDLDKLSGMQDDINKADPNKDIRSLFTNPDRTAAARLLVDDVFNFYSLDTTVLDIMPKYATDKNISLYDRVTSDIDKADVKYMMDNKIVRGLNGRITDGNVTKAKSLLQDYDEIETFQMSKLDRVIHVLNHYDKEYDHLDSIFEDSRHLLNHLDSNEIDTLSALSSSSIRDPLSDTLDSMNALSSTGLLSTSFSLTKDNVTALMESVIGDHPDLLEELVDGQLSGMEDKNGYFAVKDLEDTFQEILSNSKLTDEQKAELGKYESSMTDAVEKDGVVPKDDVEKILGSALGGTLPEPIQQAVEQMADKNGNVKIQDLLALAKSKGLPVSEDIEKALGDAALLPETDVKPMIESMLGNSDLKEVLLNSFVNSSDEIGELTDSLNGLLHNSARLQSGLKKELGSNYSSKLADAMSSLGHTKSSIDKLQDDIDDLDDDDRDELSDDLDDTEDLLRNKDDMDYLISWANKLKSMKTDMDGNQSNISILRDLIDLNDDAKVKTFRSMIPALQTDFDDSRPVLDSIKAELDQPAVNASLHKMPETASSLTRMENDLRNNRKIIDIFRLTTQPNTVSLFNDTFSTLDEFQQNGTTDHMMDLVNDTLTLRDKKDAYVNLSDQYKIFTEAADGAQTSVKFVYKTAEIKEPETAKAEPVQNAESSGKSGGLWGWVRSAWNGAVSTISHLF